MCVGWLVWVFESCQMNIGWKWTKEDWCRWDGKKKL